MWTNVIKNKYLSQNVSHMLVEPSLLHCEMVSNIKSGKNMMVISANSTDKRIGYLTGIIDMLLEFQNFGNLNVLILVPVRELCEEIYMKTKKLLFQIKNLTVIRLYQKVEELTCANILICTPGTLKKKLVSHPNLISNVHTLVVEEADRMFQHDFHADLLKISNHLKFFADMQKIIVSSTILPSNMQNPVESFYKKEYSVVFFKDFEPCNDNMETVIIPTKSMETRKVALLSLLLTSHVLGSRDKKTIIFCKTKNSVNLIAEFLIQNGFTCCILHGDLDQKIRMNSIISFNNDANIIISTDVAARGMDFKKIHQIINFELNDNYIDFYIRMEKIGGLVSLCYVFYDKKEDGHLKEKLKKYFTRVIGTFD